MKPTARIIILGTMLATAVVSCRKTDQAPEKQEVETVSLGVPSLQTRVDVSSNGTVNIVNNSGGGPTVVNDGPALELVGNVASPVYQGKTLRSTHVDISGTKLYVSYNTEGETYLGGIDVFDISSINTPTAVASIILPDVDISAVSVSNGKLFFAGAVNRIKFAPPARYLPPAVMGIMNLDANGIPTGNATLIGTKGYVGTDVQAANGKVYYTSAAAGDLVIFDTDGVVEQTQTADDARSIAVTNSRLAMLTGNGKIMMSTHANLSQQTVIHIPIDIKEAKRTCDFIDGNKLTISAGTNGMRIYDANSGNLLQSLPLPTSVPGANPNDIVTNAVSNNGSIVVSANGAAGLYVHSKEKATGQNVLGLVGQIDATGSFNYVKAEGNYIVAATGTKGIKIFRIN